MGSEFGFAGGVECRIEVLPRLSRVRGLPTACVALALELRAYGGALGLHALSLLNLEP